MRMVESMNKLPTRTGLKLNKVCITHAMKTPLEAIARHSDWPKVCRAEPTCSSKVISTCIIWMVGTLLCKVPCNDAAAAGAEETSARNTATTATPVSNKEQNIVRGSGSVIQLSAKAL